MTTQQTLFTDNKPITLDEPVLPYAGTSGWAGSDTSLERAIDADKSGTTSKRQITVIEYLKTRQHKGMTWKELADRTNWHHGTASGALSVLHKAGYITRLTERRDRCQIYVLPEYVDGRETQDYKPNASARMLMSILDDIEADLENGSIGKVIARIQATRQAIQ